MRVLACDTALGACSAALTSGDRVLAHRIEAMQRGHAEALAPMVEAVMEGHDFKSLERLAVTTGPGTFTGQRVGLAFMRALRIALHVPLVGVTTLAAMAAQAKEECGTTRAIALHDARRDEVYVEIDSPQVMRFDDALALLRALDARERVAIAGTAGSRVCEALASDRFVLSSVTAPDATWVARLSLREEAREDAPPPLYLRAPDAKLPGQR